jgi:hypothetical protein
MPEFAWQVIFSVVVANVFVTGVLLVSQAALVLMVFEASI